jgi:hypothetical protein
MILILDDLEHDQTSKRMRLHAFAEFTWFLFGGWSPAG